MWGWLAPGGQHGAPKNRDFSANPSRPGPPGRITRGCRGCPAIDSGVHIVKKPCPRPRSGSMHRAASRGRKILSYPANPLNGSDACRQKHIHTRTLRTYGFPPSKKRGSAKGEGGKPISHTRIISQGTNVELDPLGRGCALDFGSNHVCQVILVAGILMFVSAGIISSCVPCGIMRSQNARF